MSQKLLRDSNLVRWSVLIIISLIMAANYFFYDVLSPLQSLLREKLGFSNSEYGFLVSTYSIPNVFLFMAIIGGIILDKIGIRITGFIFIAFMAIGSLLTYYGSTAFFNEGGFGYSFFNSFLLAYSPSLKMMSLGYFLFGLGAETSIVVITKIVVKWFKGKELAFALGLNISIARMGTLIAFLFSRKLAEQLPWNRAIWLGASMLIISLIAYLIYIVFDVFIDRQGKARSTGDPEDEFRISDIVKIIRIPSFIYITLLCVTFYSAVFPFLKYATDMLENKFGLSGELSGIITAILPFGTIIFTPLFGLFADYRGKSASIMIYGSVLLILSHLSFTFTNISPYLPMFLLGIAFSLVPAAMWPSVAKIVDTTKIGTAYGFMFSVQNIGLWIFPIIIGFILDKSNPSYANELSPANSKKIIENGFDYKGLYLKQSGKPRCKKLKVKILVHKNELSGPIIWSESHNTHADSLGEFEISIGMGDEIQYADIHNMQIFSDTVYIEVIKLSNDFEKEVYSAKVKLNKDLKVKIDDNLLSDNLGKKASFKILLRLKHSGGEIIWSEVHKKLDNSSILLGSGKVGIANRKYFNWKNEDLYIQVLTPLDYTNSVLMLSLLGIVGLLFAILLKREDISSGFGLELPNKQT